MDELLAGLRPWSREERERYLSSLGKHEHPLFMDGEPDVRAAAPTACFAFPHAAARLGSPRTPTSKRCKT